MFNESDLSTPPICTSGSDIKHTIPKNVDDMHSMLSTSKSVQYLTEKNKKKINKKNFHSQANFWRRRNMKK